jgi:alpha-glucosidase
MKKLGTAQLVSATAHGIELSLPDGAAFSVQVLEEQLVRVRLRPSGGYREPRTWAIAPSSGRDVAWEGRARDDLSGFSCPAAQVQTLNGEVTLKTAGLSLRLRPDPLALHWQDARGRPLLNDRETSAYFTSSRTGGLRHYLARDRAERYYGLGDKTGPLNLHGRRLRTLGLDALGYDPQSGDPLYKHWPFVMTRAPSGMWWGIYYDTLAACTFDLGCEHDNYHELFRYVEIDDGDLDYYLMTGNNPAEVMAQFVKLIGGTHLPPRWSLGFAQTAMGLADAPDAQAQLNGFIDRITQENIPISSFHYGSGYSSKGKRRYVFTWNESKFPDPKKLNAKFQQAGMHLVANIKPCLLDDHPAYAGVKAQQGFIHDAVTGEPIVEQFWDGVGSHLDFTHPAVIDWWKTQLKAQVLDYGIDVGWNDNNEYAIMDDAASCHGFGAALPIHRARPLHGLLMTRASFEAQVAKEGHAQVYSVTRGGPPGLQRYAQTWSGDNTTSWETLRWNIRTGLQMSLSGMFNVGHDVGGFAGPLPDAEMFVRWVQSCSLNPRMVMNSWKAGNVSNVPWMHAQVTQHVADAIRLRYRLMPYLWSLFERASSLHQPIIRPTFYNFPDDEQCYADCDDFMLGESILVAPVVQKDERVRRVYLPAGPSAWINFHTGDKLAAGQFHEVAAALETLPLFVPEGSVIAMANPADGRFHVDNPVSEHRLFGAALQAPSV